MYCNATLMLLQLCHLGGCPGSLVACTATSCHHAIMLSCCHAILLLSTSHHTGCSQCPLMRLMRELRGLCGKECHSHCYRYIWTPTPTPTPHTGRHVDAAGREFQGLPLGASSVWRAQTTGGSSTSSRPIHCGTTCAHGACVHSDSATTTIVHSTRVLRQIRTYLPTI